MGASLRDRLEEILGAGKSRTPGRSASSIEKVVPGRMVETEFGPCYCVETRYPLDHHWGHHSLSSAVDIDPQVVCIAGKNDRLDCFDPRECIFLDTETTGLCGGSGTYVFLLGLGFYLEDSFIVEQLFMRDYPEEAAVLKVLSKLVSGRRFIATYNGKTFDVPLIESRLVMCRMEPVFEGIEHLDLLHAARRIWGRSLNDCCLTTVEERMLGFRRGFDIPGEEIPERYFSFLSSGDASGMRDVFEHNKMDVVSLAILLKEVCSAVTDVNHQRLSAPDFLSIGKIYDSMKKRDKTLPFYRKAVMNLSGDDRAAAAYRLGLACKRLGKWDDAVAAWKGLVGTGMYPAYEELAKYYEHRVKHLEKARVLIDKALSVFSGTRYENDLKHRLKRIARKMAAGGSH